MTFETNIFEQFDKKWALLSAGTAEDFNTMTISWGGMGTLWHKPVVTVYVRDSRYTYEYMERNDYFTLSFYPAEYKKILSVLGTKSGREMDKIHASGLTPKDVLESVTFEEAEVTLVCRKLFKQELDASQMPEDVAKAFYEGMAPHMMVIGEVVDIIR